MAKLIYGPLLLLLLSLAGASATSKALLEMESELGMLSSNRKDKHKHSGFSQAECPGACTFRCSKTLYHKPCMFFCQKCCFKCKCVPPGSYARKEACLCYKNWKTKQMAPSALKGPS